MKAPSGNSIRQRDPKITVDPSMDKRYNGKVLFQHKIDRILAMFSEKGITRLSDETNPSPKHK